jgi:hypothetical protein
MDSGRKTNYSESKNGGGNIKKNMEYKEEQYLSNHNDSQLLKKYIHDIRNSNTFSIDILKNINNLSYEDRMEILIVYNEMMSHYLSLFEDK